MAAKFEIETVDLVPRVIIAARDRLTADAICVALQQQGCRDCRVVIEKKDLLSEVMDGDQVKMFLLDIEKLSGDVLDVCRKAGAEGSPHMGIILCDDEDLGRAQRMLENKNISVVARSNSMQVLWLTQKFLAAGIQLVPQLVQGRTATRSIPDGADDLALSEMQAQVLRVLGQGKSNKAIAYELNLSLSTVKMHIKAICTKLGAANRTDAVLKAQKAGLI